MTGFVVAAGFELVISRFMDWLFLAKIVQVRSQILHLYEFRSCLSSIESKGLESNPCISIRRARLSEGETQSSRENPISGFSYSKPRCTFEHFHSPL